MRFLANLILTIVFLFTVGWIFFLLFIMPWFAGTKDAILAYGLYFICGGGPAAFFYLQHCEKQDKKVLVEKANWDEEMQKFIDSIPTEAKN